MGFIPTAPIRAYTNTYVSDFVYIYVERTDATHCCPHYRTLPRTAAHCHTLLHMTACTATHCCTAAAHCHIPTHALSHCRILPHTAAHCRTLPHTAAYYRTLPHIIAHCCTPPHCRTAAQCSRTHCHTLPSTLPYTAARTARTIACALPHTATRTARTAVLLHCRTLPHNFFRFITIHVMSIHYYSYKEII
jgi:hypothetical protein